MALTSITKDFVVKSGLAVQGTTSPITTATGNVGTLQVNGGAAFAKDMMVASTTTVFGVTNLQNVLNVAGNVKVGNNQFTIDSTNGNTYVAGNAGVVGTFNSTGTLSVNTDKFTVAGATGNTYVAGNAGVVGTFNSTGTLSVNTDKFTVAGATGNTYVAGNAGVVGTLNSTGTLSVNVDKFTVDGATGNIFTKGNTYIDGNTGILGTLNSTGTLSVNVNKFTVDGANGNTYVAGNAGVVGTFNSTGTLSVNTDKFTVDGSNGNTHVEGTFNVTGTSYLHSTLDVLGVTTLLDNTAGGVGAGALVVANGGASIDGDLYADSSTTAGAVGGGTGALRVAGGAYIGDNLIVNSTATDTGTNVSNALYIAGGAWIDKDLHVVRDATFGGNVTFNGQTTYVNSTNTVYTDNIINIHTPPGGINDTWTIDDGKDVGFLFHYYNGGDKNGGLILANDTHYLEWFQAGDHSDPSQFSSGTYGTFKTGSIKLADTTAASNTYSGALTVEGGVGIGGDMWVGGTIHANQIIGFGTVTANVTTATNLNYGGAGQIPIQNGSGSTTFIAAGTSNNQVLTWNNSTATWASASGTVVGNAGRATTATNIDNGAQYDIPFQSGFGLTTFDTGIFAYNSSTKVLSINNISVNGLTGNDATTQIAAAAGESIELYSDTFAELNYNGTNFIYVNVSEAALSVGATTTTFALNTSGNAVLGGSGYIQAPHVRADNLTDTRLVFSDSNHELTDSANLTFDGTNLTIGGSGGDITMTNGNITGVNHISATEVTAATLTATSNLYLTSKTQNSVLYVGANGAVSEDNTNFTWSASGNQLNAANITGSIVTATTTLYVTGAGSNSTNTAASGALQVTGGVGIAGGLYVDQDAYVNADLYVQGTLYVQGNSLDGVDTITGSTGTFADITSTGTITANILNVSGLTHSSDVTGALFNNTGTGALVVDGGIYSGDNIVASGVIAGGDGIAPGSGTIAEGLYIHNNMQAGGTWAGVSGTTAKLIDSWDKTLYTSAKYIVQIVDGSNIHTEELMVIQDGTDVYITEYGIITTAGGELGVFDGVISGSNVNITFTPTGATAMTIQTVRQSVLTNSQYYW